MTRVRAQSQRDTTPYANDTYRMDGCMEIGAENGTINQDKPEHCAVRYGRPVPQKFGNKLHVKLIPVFGGVFWYVSCHWH